MARAAPTFRQSDVTRALRAAAVAGVDVQRVEISAGKIVLVTSSDEATTKPSNGGTALDGWRASRDPS